MTRLIKSIAITTGVMLLIAIIFALLMLAARDPFVFFVLMAVFVPIIVFLISYDYLGRKQKDEQDGIK